MVCVSDAVELAVASWVEPLVHVTVKSVRVEEHMRATLVPSICDVVPLGFRVGGLNTEDKKYEYIIIINTNHMYYTYIHIHTWTD